MSETYTVPEEHDEPGFYVIRVKGHLEDRWAARFAGLTLTRADNGNTLLTGRVVDQAALHGLLRKVRDLGLPLISVIGVQPAQPMRPQSNRKWTPAPHRKKSACELAYRSDRLKHF